MRTSTTYRLALAFWVAVLAAVFLFLVPGVAWPEVLTHDGAMAKIQEWGPDKTADKIVALDTILRADPTVSSPALIVVVDRDGMMHIALDGPMVVEVPGLLRYELTPTPWVLPDPTPDRGAWPYLIGGAVGVLVGGLLVFLAVVLL